MTPETLVAWNVGLSAILGVLALALALEVPRAATGWLGAYRWVMGAVSLAAVYVALIGGQMYFQGISPWGMVWQLEPPLLVLKGLVVACLCVQGGWMSRHWQMDPPRGSGVPR